MSFLSLRPFSSNRLISLALATLLPACVAEQEPTLQGAVADVGSSANQAALDGGLLLPDAADASTAAPAAADETSELTTLAEFRGTVDVAAGTMRLTVLDGDAVTDAGLRRAQQGLCALTIVQDGVPGSGPANSMELVTGTTGLDAACDGYLASPLFCGAVTVRSFYATAQSQVFAQILALAPSTGFSVQNGDVVPGASSGIGSWAYGDLSAAASAPTNEGVRNWVFARSGGNFTFTGRLVANVPELCDGLDNDCDGLTDEGNGCRTQGQSCTASSDCVSPLACTAGLCAPTVCPAGEHLEGAFCLSDTRTCTLTGGAGEQVWNGSGWDLCVASSCDSAYALVSGSCQLVVCGDGTARGSEGCDDGNVSNGDGCSAVCASETGYLCFGAPSVCQGICGDGIVAGAEACDDGNVENGDSCSATCQCGTGFHFEGGACISDTRSCLPPPPGIATGTQTWSGSSWGICLAATCATGYHLEGGACPRNPVAYVVNGYVVLVMDTITQLVTATIPVGSYPTQVAVNSSGTFAYVTNADSGSVSVIDTASNTVTSTIAVGVGASGIALSPTAATAFVASYFISKLSVINTTTNQVTATIDVGASPNRVAVNPTGTLAYVADRMVGGVSVIDTATNTITANIAVGDPADPGFDYTPTADIAINSAGTLAYALVGANPFSYNDEFSKIAVIDTATNTVTATIPVGGMAMSEEGALTVNAAGTRLYVATWESNSVSVIDTATNTVITEIAVGIAPTALSMGATDAVLYVANTYNDSVSVIDTTTNTVTTTLAVGSPMAIAVFTPPTPLANGTLCNRNAACDSGYCNTSPPGTANDLCATAICGNGVTEGSEGCDDGNLVDTDFCTATCTPAACGDGILLDLYEECDDGNLLTEECIYGEASCVVCDDACALFAGETDFCGDGILDAAELCDDGNTADGDSCSSTCVCGVGFHLEGGACISDTRNCLPPPTGIATGTQTWSGTSWAICLAATCATGYHLEGGTCPRNPVAYVVNEYLGTVSVIDTVTQLVTTTIPVGVTPRWVTVNSSGTFAYVTNADSGSVSVIDTATNTVSATVAVGQNPSGVALSPTGSSAYVTNFGDSSLSVFNTTSNTVTTNFLIGNSPWRVAVNPAGTLAYVAMRNSPTMPVIDTATNTVTATIPLGTSSGPGESGAVGIALNGAGTLAYALLPAEWFSGPTGMQSRVKVIDTATNTVTATIPVGGMAISEEGSLTVNAAGTRLYVATWESNSVSVIDTATNTVIAEIAVGIQPTALSMGATDALLYVTNREDDAVKVIDTATNTVTATIPVGIHPVAIAVASPPAPLGALCALNGQCASGFCATGPDGNANDRCAPLGMNYIPAGTFTMGSPSGEVGRSTIEEQHTVTISRGLYIGQTEVTQAQWKALSGGINPSYFQSTTGTEQSTANANDSGPVEQIDWYSAVAFANAKSAADGLTACYILINCDDPIDGWKDGIHAGCNDATFAGVPCTGYRLPTESESQYAARGGTTTATFGGDLSGDTGCVTVSGAGSVLPGTPLSDLAWYACNAGGRTHQVAEKVANGFGLYDVLGNAWEWTGDWSGNYPASGVSDPTGPATGTGRVLSGCSWNGTAACTRSAIRGYYGSNDRVWDVGFRLVRTAF